MNHFRLVVDNTTYEIEILNDPRSEEVQVKVDGTACTVKVEDLSVETAAVKSPVRNTTPAPVQVSAPATDQPAVSGGNTVRAPLPGKINAIKVQAGQTVKVNDPLVVIEAMKAQNIIRAQKDGKIAKIYVSVGGHIAYGAPILDIE